MLLQDDGARSLIEKNWRHWLSLWAIDLVPRQSSIHHLRLYEHCKTALVSATVCFWVGRVTKVDYSSQFCWIRNLRFASPDTKSAIGLAPVICCARHQGQLWAASVLQHCQASHTTRRSVASSPDLPAKQDAAKVRFRCGRRANAKHIAPRLSQECLARWKFHKSRYAFCRYQSKGA